MDTRIAWLALAMVIAFLWGAFVALWWITRAMYKEQFWTILFKQYPMIEKIVDTMFIKKIGRDAIAARPRFFE